MNSIARWLAIRSTVLTLAFLPTPRASAEPIRVRLVMPTTSGRLARQVSRLNEALARSQTHVVAAPSLQEADAIVEVTGYRRTVGDRGQSLDWWDVEFKLLSPVASEPALSGERTRLLVIGREEWEVEPALDLLSDVLTRALGRQRRVKDAI